MYGEGTVRYNARRGKWIGRFEKHDGRAKRQRGWVSADSEAEAWRKLRAKKSTSATLPALDERLRLDTFLRSWLDDHVASTVRPRTLDNYRNIVEGHLVPALGGHKLAALRPPHVLVYRNAKMTELSARSVSHHLAVLRSALGQAERWGMVPRNVAALVPGPHVPDADVKPLTTAQVRALLDAVKGDEWEAIYLLAAIVGMRQGEILGLRWQDIDGSHLEVRRTLSWLHGKATLEEPKTERSHRRLALSSRVRRALDKRRRAQAAARLGNTHWNPRWTEGYDLVFTDGDGYAIERTAVTRALQRHLAAGDLPQVSFHSLRHSATDWLHELGLTMREIADILGHAKPSMTSDTYAHLGTSATDRAAVLMDKAFG